MSIEIRELIIRTQITTDGSGKVLKTKQPQFVDDKDLVDRCVEKVIKILKKKSDR